MSTGRCTHRARSAPRCAIGCRAPKGRSKQVVNFASGIDRREAVIELDVDEPHEERIERATRGQELLGDLGERPFGRHHPCQRGHLTAGTLGVSDGRSPIGGARAAHGDTYAAPVIPVAACPGRVQMQDGYPGSFEERAIGD